MLIVKTNHTTVIMWVKLVIYVSEIVPGNIPMRIFPSFTT